MENRQYSLKELRARYNMTQLETAKKMGVSLTTYNAWEKDIGHVKVSKVKELATLFGVTLNDIFLG